jgi:hypothetical protein
MTASHCKRIMVGFGCSSIVLHGVDIVDSLEGFIELCPWSKSAQGAAHVDVTDLKAVDIAGVDPTKTRKVSLIVS